MKVAKSSGGSSIALVTLNEIHQYLKGQSLFRLTFLHSMIYEEIIQLLSRKTVHTRA